MPTNLLWIVFRSSSITEPLRRRAGFSAEPTNRITGRKRPPQVRVLVTSTLFRLCFWINPGRCGPALWPLLLASGATGLRPSHSSVLGVSFERSHGRFPSRSRSHQRADGPFSSLAFARARSALICSRIEGSSFGTGAVATCPWAEVVIASNVTTSAVFINQPHQFSRSVVGGVPADKLLWQTAAPSG
jgi:hypothetical protein